MALPYPEDGAEVTPEYALIQLPTLVECYECPEGSLQDEIVVFNELDVDDEDELVIMPHVLFAECAHTPRNVFFSAEAIAAIISHGMGEQTPDEVVIVQADFSRDHDCSEHEHLYNCSQQNEDEDQD